jgi:hypothetical protein
MDMSGMGGMAGGMDMASGGMFTQTNKAIAHGYWYAIAAVVLFYATARLIEITRRRRRLHGNSVRFRSVTRRGEDSFWNALATITATFRELSYPQPVYFSGSISKYFTQLPIGHWLLLAIYWTTILVMLWSNTILKPKDPMYAYHWEKVGFRAAWVTITQIPLVYLLSTKANPLTFFTGFSYERINWLHRWIARTVFLTAIVHWSFFLREWWLADFVALEIQMMPMVSLITTPVLAITLIVAGQVRLRSLWSNYMDGFV